MSPSSHRQAPVPSWKVLLGALSLLLAALIWTSGLVNSLSRPSVAPSLNLQQQEVQLLAEPALPHAIGSALLGSEDPRTMLLGSLEQIPATDRSRRQAQLLALLQTRTRFRDRASDDPLLKQLLAKPEVASRTIASIRPARGNAGLSECLAADGHSHYWNNSVAGADGGSGGRRELAGSDGS